MGHSTVKAQLGHGQRRQFALPQPGQHQGHVDQRPFPHQPLQPFSYIGAHGGVALALARPLADRKGFEQGPFPGDGKQLYQFLLGPRSALAARVGLLVRLRHPVKRVHDQAVVAGCAAPVSCRRRLRKSGKNYGSGRPCSPAPDRQATSLARPGRDSPARQPRTRRKAFAADGAVPSGVLRSNRRLQDRPGRRRYDHTAASPGAARSRLRPSSVRRITPTRRGVPGQQGRAGQRFRRGSR